MKYGPSVAITRRRRLFGNATPPVDLESLASRSVRLPQNNLYQTSEVAGAAVIHWNTANTSAFLKPERGDMVYIRVRFPWHSGHVLTNLVHTILGNSQTSSSSTFASYIRMAAMGKTDQRVTSFNFGSNATSVNGTLPVIPLTTTDMTFGFWVDGATASGNLHAAVIDSVTLTQIGSTVTVPFTNFAGVASFPHLAIGGIVDRSSGVLSGTSCGNFEIDTFGIYANGGNNGTLADPLAKLIQIAGGANPNDVFGTQMHLLCRKWTDPADLDAPVANSEYAGPARPDPVFSALSLNSEPLMKGGTIGRQAESDYLAVEPIRENGVFPIRYGQTTATFTIDGQTSLADGQVVQARLFSSYDGTVALDWTDVATVASGAFTATITSPATKYLGNIEFRAKSDPDNAALQYVVRRPLGVGYLAPYLAQSQGVIFFYLDGDGTGSPVLSNPGVDQVVATFGKNFGAATVAVYSILLNEHYKGVDDGLRFFAKRWMQHTTAPVELVAHVKGSTSQIQLADNAQTTRDWSDSAALASVTGPKISALLEQFGTSAAVVSSEFYESEVIDEFHLGKTAGTAPTINLNSGGSYVRNHSLKGASKDDDTFYSGVDWDFPIIMCPLSRHGDPTDRIPISDVSEDGASLINFRKYRMLRQAQQSAAGNNPDDIILGLYFNDIYAGETTGFHQRQDSIYGDGRFGIRTADALAAGLGLVNLQAPEITGISIAGSRITVSFDMKGMGSLVTGTDLTGVAVPGGYPAITGFEVDEGGGPTLSGFTPSLGSNEVYLDKDGGADWDPATSMRYCWGAPAARDEGDHACAHGLLYADTGVDTSDDFGKAAAGVLVAGPAGPFTAL